MDRLNALLSRQVLLVEFSCTLRSGVSVEVACEAINRLSDDLVAYSNGLASERWGTSLTVQMDPNAAKSLGVVLNRVLLNPLDCTVGYRWECYGCGRLEDFVGSLIDRIDVSSPGSFDDAQPWP